MLNGSMAQWLVFECVCLAGGWRDCERLIFVSMLKSSTNKFHLRFLKTSLRSSNASPYLHTMYTSTRLAKLCGRCFDF